MTMETLDEYNRRRARETDEASKPIGNGIACPKCGRELHDSDHLLLMSNPPRKNVKCDQCGYTGTRIA